MISYFYEDSWILDAKDLPHHVGVGHFRINQLSSSIYIPKKESIPALASITLGSSEAHSVSTNFLGAQNIDNQKRSLIWFMKH